MAQPMNKFCAFLVLSLLVSGCDSLPSWMGGSKKEFTPLPGEREDVLRGDTAFKPDEILQNVTFKIPPATENASWAQHTGQVNAATANLALKGDLSHVASTSVGEGNSFGHALVPRPVVADGRLYAMDSVGYISAHDAADISTKLWTAKALVDEDENDAMGGGLAVDGGRVYAISGAGMVAALDAATGAAIWQRNLGIPLRSAPRVEGSKLFIITIDSQLFALDAASGATLWSHRGIGETAGLMNNVSPAIAADAVIVPYASGELYALKQDTGDEIWRESLAQSKRTEATAIFSGIGGDPVVDEAVVFAVSSSGVFSVFSILNGQPVWTAKIASINTPWLVGEYVFALSEDNVLVAMVKYDGRIRWTAQLKRFDDEKRSLKPIVWRGPLMVDGKLLLVNTYGEMVLVDAATGAISSTFDVSNNMSTAPVAAGGRVYLINKDATLYSFQ
jgi:outer membrane protein assembly factor BamB